MLWERPSRARQHEHSEQCVVSPIRELCAAICWCRAGKDQRHSGVAIGALMGSFDGAQIQGLEVLLHFRGHYFVTHRFVESSGAVVESENTESKSMGALGTRVVFR